MSGEFSQGLFGCFSNCGLCIVTYFLPCYRMGKIAEGLGDSCCIYTCLFFVPILNIILRVGQRGRIRERQGIDGGTIGDCIRVVLCAPCTLVQEGAEIEVMSGGMAVDMERQ